MSNLAYQSSFFQRGTNGRPELLLQYGTLSPNIEVGALGFDESSGTSLSGYDSVDELVRTLSSFLTVFSERIQTLVASRIIIDPEVKEKMETNPWLRKLMSSAIFSVLNVLHLENVENYIVNIFCERDIEAREWVETVISIYVEERDYEDEIRLWEQIEDMVRSSIEKTRNEAPESERRIIDKINENLSIRIEELAT